MEYPQTVLVIDATPQECEPASKSEPCPASVASYAVAAVCDRGLWAQKLDVRRLPRLALYEGYRSDRIIEAEESIRGADVVFVVLDAARPESLGLFNLLVARLSSEVWSGKAVAILVDSQSGSRSELLASAALRILNAAGALIVEQEAIARGRDGFDLELDDTVSSALEGAARLQCGRAGFVGASAFQAA